MTYRKARSALLDTARQNLTESAVRKAESIEQSFKSLQANLSTASHAAIFKLNTKEKYQDFVEQLAQQLPTKIQCVQLTDLATGHIAASSCGDQVLANLDNNLRFQTQPQLLIAPDKINVELVMPLESVTTSKDNGGSSSKVNQLELLFKEPVYDINGKLRYSLSFQDNTIAPKTR